MGSSAFYFVLLPSLTVAAACSPSIADRPAQSPPPAHEHGLHLTPHAGHPALRIPESLRSEHARIHAALVDATQAPGHVGDAARELARVLHPHFVREEEIALPPLGLLAPLAAGEFSVEMQSALPMTDALRNELAQMRNEHVQIGAATRRLQEVSIQAGDAEREALARELLAHAENEEQVLYPAAILVGEIIRSRSEHHGGAAAAR